MKSRKDQGYFSPSDLVVLQDCLHTLTTEYQLKKEGVEAKRLAYLLLANHRQGISGKDELLEAVRLEAGLSPRQ